MAVGDELQYADELTLIRSLQQRLPYEQASRAPEERRMKLSVIVVSYNVKGYFEPLPWTRPLAAMDPGWEPGELPS